MKVQSFHREAATQLAMGAPGIRTPIGRIPAVAAYLEAVEAAEIPNPGAHPSNQFNEWSEAIVFEGDIEGSVDVWEDASGIYVDASHMRSMPVPMSPDTARRTGWMLIFMADLKENGW